MTEISLGCVNGRKVALAANGHAEFSEKGQDVVCAAVSALVQALFYGFYEVLKEKNLRSKIDSEKAIMALDWSKCESKSSAVLAETIIGSLKEIARAYPGHVSILEVRLNEMDF